MTQLQREQPSFVKYVGGYWLARTVKELASKGYTVIKLERKEDGLWEVRAWR